MSVSFHIFMRPLQSSTVADVAADVKSIVPIDFSLIDRYGDTVYTGRAEGYNIEVQFVDDWEDEEAMLFSTHKYMVDFYSLEGDRKATQEYMHEFFQRLDALGKYSLFSTYDTQYILDSHFVK